VAWLLAAAVVSLSATLIGVTALEVFDFAVVEMPDAGGDLHKVVMVARG